MGGGTQTIVFFKFLRCFQCNTKVENHAPKEQIPPGKHHKCYVDITWGDDKYLVIDQCFPISPGYQSSLHELFQYIDS